MPPAAHEARTATYEPVLKGLAAAKNATADNSAAPAVANGMYEGLHSTPKASTPARTKVDTKARAAGDLPVKRARGIP